MPLIMTHRLECDLLVAGGGMAGVCCALAAARLGTRVILCQDRPVLGGNASSEVRMHIVGATGLHGGVPLQIEPREGGLIEEMRLEQAVHNPQRSPAMFDLMLYHLCRAEANLTLLLSTTVVAAQVEHERIIEVIAERPATEDRFAIKAKMFADCTGDGRLAAEAGAEHRQGREGRVDYGESLAPAEGDRSTLGSTILFQARKHDRPMPYAPPFWARRFEAEDFRSRPFGKEGFDLGLEYGYWWIEWGGTLDTIKDAEHIRDELLAIVLGVWDFIKNRSGIDAACWALDWIGFVPGKRESRRFIGQHVLTEHDVLASREFPDAIAFGGWPIDLHPAQGIDARDEPPCIQHHLPFLFNIPLRSCVAASVRNLFFAGRNIAASHVAFASTRVMATCAAIGQGVGTAAALAIKRGREPAEIAADGGLMNSIQQRLLRDDAYLVGVLNEDPDDLARIAEVVGSSWQPGAEPGLVTSGQTRSVHGDETTVPMCAVAPPERAHPGLHRWMSDPAQPFPAWLEVRWTSPVSVAEIQLVFDTGMHRFLTLSQADGYTQRMIWGQPQPETVRDYSITAECADGAALPIAAVTGNYQRRRVHRFERISGVVALRIEITATNGLDHARLFEVRAYG